MNALSMLRASRALFLAVFLCVGAVKLSGCAGVEVDENDPASLMADAEDDIGADRYQVAIDKLRVIRNKFPYSKYAVEAQLRIADVYFLQESYAEAAVAYETFCDLHPKHARVEYAMYRMGESHFQDMPTTVARDMGSGTRALVAFEEFARRFPNAKNVGEARARIATIRGLLADKELYVGEFYFKRDAWDSAKSRFQKVIALYPDTSAAKAAQLKLDVIANADKKTLEDAAEPARKTKKQ